VLSFLTPNSSSRRLPPNKQTLWVKLYVMVSMPLRLLDSIDIVDQLNIIDTTNLGDVLDSINTTLKEVRPDHHTPRVALS
jgi:hypothetical protein